MTFESASPYHCLNRGVPKEKDKYENGVVGGQYYIFTSILFKKLKLQCRCFAPFSNSKILFHKISVRSNIVFYDLVPFIILQAIPTFLFKGSNCLEL